MTPNSTPPLLSIWFGNFFEPFFSNRDAVRRGIAEVADLGFNSINLDSKPWEDFFARYRGEPASPYVAMQEFMMAQAAALGLDYTHLALYLCGDNLYPTIRDVPPVRGEEPTLPNGSPMGTYKYWSPRAQKTMLDHVAGLLKLYRPGMRRLPHIPPGSPQILMQTMFEPIPKPSFDTDGTQRYLAWLQNHYAHNIAALNQKYALSAKSFADLTPAQYWLRPEELNWVNCARPTAQDFAHRTPDFHRWIDNQTYLADELNQYLATMKAHWRSLDPELFIEPVLHQWGYFFNPPGQAMWQTGQRALDVYRCAPHVDGVLFIASPLNAENRPDPIALSVEASIMRSANAGRPFTAGLYLGRHVNGDIYAAVPPAEALATHVAAGAARLHTYGYSGLDDGGVLFRMDPLFKSSLRTGLHWAAQVIPRLTAPRTKEVALLFPAEMSLYEPLEVDTEGRHRMDLLGWYSQFLDLGYHVDILHPTQITAGALSEYKHLVIPHNSLYDLHDNTPLEAAVTAFVQNGGTLFHGPHCHLARRAFNITEETIPFDCIQWQEEIIPHGWSTVAFTTSNPIIPNPTAPKPVASGDEGNTATRNPPIASAPSSIENQEGGRKSKIENCLSTPLATYIESRLPAILQTSLGAGRIFSFGFQYGHAYSRLTMPIVPPAYGRREMHPLVLLQQTPIAALLGPSPHLPIPPVKGLESARFGPHLILVNHRSTPIDISAIPTQSSLPQLPTAPGILPAHSATCLKII